MRLYNKILYGLMVSLSLSIVNSCNSFRNRGTLITDIKSIYKQNYSEFQSIRKYLAGNADSVISIEVISKTNVINLRKKSVVDTTINWPTTFNSISEAITEKYITDDSYLPEIINLMDKIGLRSVSGDSNWVYVTFRDFTVPCFGFWYKKNFDTTNLEIKKKILNFTNIKSQDWIYPVEQNWFIQGEKCF